jgi:hypothetical protein
MGIITKRLCDHYFGSRAYLNFGFYVMEIKIDINNISTIIAASKIFLGVGIIEKRA